MAADSDLAMNGIFYVVVSRFALHLVHILPTTGAPTLFFISFLGEFINGELNSRRLRGVGPSLFPFLLFFVRSPTTFGT
jgi:hypothetical protein